MAQHVLSDSRTYCACPLQPFPSYEGRFGSFPAIGDWQLPTQSGPFITPLLIRIEIAPYP